MLVGKFFAKALLGAAILGAAIVSPSSARAAGHGSSPHAQDTAATGRTVLPLLDGWRFHQGDVSGGVTEPGFDDTGWQVVSVPHTWNRLGEYALQRSEGADNYQGVSWYRLHVAAPHSGARRRQYLDFAAVGKIADVWVNGIKVGHHEGAFARFRLDVTAAWKAGSDNIVAVRADNSKPTADNATGQVIPLSGDFFVNGGIYRKVTLVTASDAGIDLLDYGGPGVYAHAARIDADAARIDVLVRLRNLGRGTRKLKLTTVIRDADGREIARKATQVRLGRGQDEQQETLDLPRPHLWNGRKDPYLYSISVEVSERGRLTDGVTVPLGVRTFRFDPDKGFFLNGEHVKLQGVSRHQDRMGKGWALGDADHDEDMALIAELGANTIRQAHYQHADRWTADADNYGMVVWAELPYVTTPSLSGGKGSEHIWANADQQLRELIRQDYNHPSIMMWSVGNEVDSAKGFGVAGDPPQPLPLLQHLAALAKQEDPTRPTTFADCCEGLGLFQTAGEHLAGTADLIGYNRYFGWYMPNPLDARAQFGAALDKLHAAHPALPISISEYGAGGAPSQHSDNVRDGFVNMVGRPQPEEFESFVHEQIWPSIRARDYIFASWVWNMFDFPSDLRAEGDSVDLNTKGLVTYDRKIKKDAFYYYKAQWNPEPMIHLNSKRYVDRAYPVTDVEAYTNAPKAALTVNGKLIGEVACEDRICRWSDVALQPGPNGVAVSAKLGDVALADSATWNGPDLNRGGIGIDAGNLAGEVVHGRRFGSDDFVNGGRPMVLNFEGFGHKAAHPRVVESAEPELFRFWREGEAFSYRIPLPDGDWEVTLYTFEPSAAPAAGKTMSVTANGKLALPAFSVAQAAGGPLKELQRNFKVHVAGGALNLDFAGHSGNAIVAAIVVRK